MFLFVSFTTPKASLPFLTTDKVLNMNELYEVMDRFKTWYIDKKFFAAVKPETLDPDGTLTLTAHEPRLRRIDVKVQSGDK